jgi:hypothetical protein
MFYLSLSTTIIKVDRAILCSYPVPSKKQRKDPHFDKCRLLFAHPITACLLRVCPWRLVMPLRQRGGQPIPLRRPHLRRLRRRPSRLRQRLRHSSLSPHPPKWIPLPLHQPPRPPMDRPLPSPVVWRLLSMLRILSNGGGGALAGRWRCQGVGVGARLLSEEGGGRDNQH